MACTRWIHWCVLVALQFKWGDGFASPRPAPSLALSTRTWQQPVGPKQPIPKYDLPRTFAANEVVSWNTKKSLGGIWRMIVPFMVALREATATMLNLAVANEWQINLVKHVLTLISIGFVLKTFLDIKRTKFYWKKIPSYLLACLLVVAGGLWIDAIFVIPYYGINIFQQALCLFGAGKISKIFRLRGKEASSPSLPPPSAPPSLEFKPEAAVESKPEAAVESKTEAVTLPDEEVVPPPPKPLPPPPTVNEKHDPFFAKKKVENEESVEVEETSEPIFAAVVQENAVDEADNGVGETVLEEEEASSAENETVPQSEEKREKLFEESLQDFLYFLANIQDEMAEIQLKQIPEAFSRDSYVKLQERITKFQMKQFQGGDDKEKQKQKQKEKD